MLNLTEPDASDGLIVAVNVAVLSADCEAVSVKEVLSLLIVIFEMVETSLYVMTASYLPLFRFMASEALPDESVVLV